MNFPKMSTVIIKNKKNHQQNHQKNKGHKGPAARKGKPKQRTHQRFGKTRPPGPNNMRPMRIPGSGAPGSGLAIVGNAPTSRKPMHLEEDELIGLVNASTGFGTTQYPCNIGQVGTFPWGNRIAQLYEMYEFDLLEFYFTSTVSAYNNEGQQGEIVLSFDYDASDSAPTTQVQVENTKPHTLPCLPSTPMVILSVDCKVAKRTDAKFVRPGALPANTDIKTYDIGNLYVSTNGCYGNGQIGELHVRYKCRLSEPVLEASSLVGGAVQFSSIGSTTADNFAGSFQQPGGTVALQSITVGLNTITIPSGIPGNYQVVMQIAGATSASVFSYSSSTGGVTVLKLMTYSNTKDNNSQIFSNAGTTTSSAMWVFNFNVTNAGGTIVISPSTIVGNASMDCFIYSLPSTLLTVTEPLVQLQEMKEELSELKQQMALWKRQIHSSSDYAIVDQQEEKTPSLEREEESLCRFIAGSSQLAKHSSLCVKPIEHSPFWGRSK